MKVTGPFENEKILHSYRNGKCWCGHVQSASDTPRYTVSAGANNRVILSCAAGSPTLEEAYVRVVWSYKLRNGDDVSVVGCFPTTEREGVLSAKLNVNSMPAGSRLQWTYVEVTDIEDAEYLDSGSGDYAVYGEGDI